MTNSAAHTAHDPARTQSFPTRTQPSVLSYEIGEWVLRRLLRGRASIRSSWKQTDGDDLLCGGVKGQTGAQGRGRQSTQEIEGQNCNPEDLDVQMRTPCKSMSPSERLPDENQPPYWGGH